MSKYILQLIDKDPVNNQTIPCSSGLEVLFYKNQAIKMGFKVKVSKAKNDKGRPVSLVMDELKIMQNMALAQNGTGKEADEFNALGVCIVDLNGNTRSGQNVFDEYIKALENIENTKTNMEGKE